MDCPYCTATGDESSDQFTTLMESVDGTRYKCSTCTGTFFVEADDD